MVLALPFLLISLAQAPGVHQSPRILTEDGQVLALAEGSRVAVYTAGQIVVPFSFQASEQDPATGAWLEPELHAVYSLRNPDADPAAAGERWVYGDGVDAPKAVIQAFDPATGRGQALAVLPTGIVTRSRAWGHIQPGPNELVVYWGTRSQIHNDGVLPPSSPMGTWRTVIEGFWPAVTVRFLSGRALKLNQPARVVLHVREPRREETVFRVQPESRPESFTCPTEVRLPAGQSDVSFQVIPRILGQDRLVLTSDAFPGESFRTQLGVVSQPVRVVPVGPPGGSSPDLEEEPSPVPQP